MKHQNKNGFIALISLLIIGAVVLLIGTGLSLRSIGETNMSLAQEQSQKAGAMADLCAEQALMKLESVLNYSGNETLTVDGISCTIFTIGGVGNTNRTITVQSAVGGYARKVKLAVAQISPTMQITSWEKTPDF